MDDEVPEDPQTLYQAWKGHWPFRQWLYVGVTNSPSRRFGEHRRHSEWMPEAGTIRLTRYTDRESVLDAEKRMIQAKHPRYNVQHNRHEVRVELTAENLAALGAAICASVLALRWIADASSAWWVQRQADRQGVTVELPARRNPFTEPSRMLTMLEFFVTVMAPEMPLSAPGGGTLPPWAQAAAQRPADPAVLRPVQLPV